MSGPMPEPEHYLSCSELPPKVNSLGVWKLEKGPLKYPLPLLQMQIIFILAVIHTLHFVLKRFGLPMLISEIAAGILLGLALEKNKAYSEMFFNVESQNIIGTLSIFGYALFMFLIGVKMDIGMISTTGKKALAVGILAVLGPLIVGMPLSFVLAFIFVKEATYLPYIAAMQSLTPFPVMACLLSELKILNSELGRLTLSSAIVSDLFSLFLTIVAILFENGIHAPLHTLAINLVSPAIFVLVVVYILRPAMFWVVAQTPEGRAVKNAYLYAIILVLLFCGLFSDLFGQYVIFGAFIFGLAVPDGPPLGSALVEKLDSMVSLLLMPVFMATCAMRANVNDVFRMEGRGGPVVSIIVILVILITKIGACVVPLLYCKMPRNDALALGLIMSAKGTVNMATQSFMRDSGVVDDKIFGLLVIATILNAAIVPFLVRKLYDPSRKYAGYQRRNIMHCKPNAELRILACVHEQEGVTSIINLLNASNPTRDNPISIYVLHLIELVGRATPVFISHDMQKRTASSHSYSENVILALNRYQRNNGGAALAHIFTAISPPKFMHEDICTLALNKQAVFMIIPFHRKWNMGGSIESEEQRIRNLNCSVLDMAPCSIGILVDRGQLGRSASQSFYIALIFLGGNDDREGLAYAKRMASGPNVNLTIAHFLPMDDENTTEWENILDDEALKDIKHGNLGFEQVNYLQKVVKDGPQTALIVRQMASEYDLIIVGRRHGVESPLTSGLTEWSEFPELGALGDLLAASDLDSNASVLVVQQQRKL